MIALASYLYWLFGGVMIAIVPVWLCFAIPYWLYEQVQDFRAFCRRGAR